MNILSLKWTKGAPKALECGQAIRLASTGAIVLVGSHVPDDTRDMLTKDCAEWVSVIAPFELEWIGSTGALGQ